MKTTTNTEASPSRSPSYQLDIAQYSEFIDCSMTSITIRRLPASTKEKLRVRAARSGVSLESYTRQILQTASEVDPGAVPDLADLAQACFGKTNGIDLNLPSRGENRPPLSFD